MTSTSRPDATRSAFTPGGSRAGTMHDPLELQKHIAAAYFDLRVGIAVLGFALPVVISLGALLVGRQPLQASMSAYYFAGNGVMRDEFVGILVGVGAFLILYKGFSREENWALNLAGVSAWCVALFPTQWQCAANCRPVSLHGTAAVLLFLCIAYVCLFRAMDTLSVLPDQTKVPRYQRTYRALGAAMIVSPLAAVLTDGFLPRKGNESHMVFFIEAFAVWVFAAYWLTKSLELRASSAEQMALEGKLARATARRRLLPSNAMVVRMD